MKRLQKLLGMIVIGVSLFFSFNPFVLAQTEYPTRPISLLVGYPPGGGTDLVGRTLAEIAQKILKQPVVIANKPGASASLAMSLLAQAKPDGYTLGMSTSTATVFLPIIQKLTYDPLKDFTYIVGCANSSMAFVVNA